MELSQEVWCVDVVMCIYTWVHRTHACTTFASKVKVNLYTYNQVESTNFASKVKVNYIHITKSRQDVVMCIYTWVRRTHACTNFASKVKVKGGKYMCERESKSERVSILPFD